MDNKLLYPGGIVVFDSNCVLCSNTFKFLISIDRKKKLRFTTFDSPLWNTLSNGYKDGIPFLNTIGHSESIVFYQFPVKENGQSKEIPEQSMNEMPFQKENYYFQSDAVIKIIETLSLPWNLLRIIKLVPRNLREKAYRIVARNRYLIFGKKSFCTIPDEKKKDRYIL